MTTYAFILGRKQLLSIAEICNVLPDTAHIIDVLPTSLIVSIKNPLKNPQGSLNRLGGTIKIIEIFSEQPNDPHTISSEISKYLIDTFQEKKNKLNFGVSLYSFAQKNKEVLKNILKNVKKDLKNSDMSSRFINKDFKNLESAAIHHENLLKEGADIVAIEGHHKIFIGRTVALQQFENYSDRDYNRPERDPHLGMLPPKLAQIMINLAGLSTLGEEGKPQTIIYDPFCGTGTTLTEALLMGFGTIGSDISEIIIEKSRKNIEFTVANQNTYGQIHRLFTKDAALLTAKDVPEDISAIVTESYLGPPITQFPIPEQLQKTQKHIQELMYRFFKAVHPIIKSETPIVISLPVYRRSDRMFFIEKELIDKITKIGFKVAHFIPKELMTKFNLKSYERESLIYDRPDQIVGREIWKFIKI